MFKFLRNLFTKKKSFNYKTDRNIQVEELENGVFVTVEKQLTKDEETQMIQQIVDDFMKRNRR